VNGIDDSTGGTCRALVIVRIVGAFNPPRPTPVLAFIVEGCRKTGAQDRCPKYESARENCQNQRVLSTAMQH
jgi:hypothetical protein